MYAILVSIALAIYSLILIDFSLLFQEISVNADVTTSVQALYAAEGTIESSFGIAGEIDPAQRNLKFIAEDEVDNNSVYDNLEYNEGAESFYVKRHMSLSGSDLNVADAFNPNNKLVTSGAYLSNGQTMDQKAYYGLEPRKARSFVIRETRMEDNFNEISFEYNQDEEDSDLVFEVLIFPKEGVGIDFADFERLKNGERSSVNRIVINTRDIGKTTFEAEGQNIKVQFGGYSTNYKNQLRVYGFQPLEYNYIIHFQTLDNIATHFKLSAFRQSTSVMLPSMMQTIDVIGATPTGLYQRVKVQRQTEEGVMPGLNFVHFSDGGIHK